MPSLAARSWPFYREAVTTHTGLAFLAFFSDLTDSSWAFRFSASLLAYEEEEKDQAVMAASEQGRGFPLFLLEAFP